MTARIVSIASSRRRIASRLAVSSVRERACAASSSDASRARSVLKAWTCSTSEPRGGRPPAAAPSRRQAHPMHPGGAGSRDRRALLSFIVPRSTASSSSRMISPEPSALTREHRPCHEMPAGRDSRRCADDLPEILRASSAGRQRNRRLRGLTRALASVDSAAASPQHAGGKLRSR